MSGSVKTEKTDVLSAHTSPLFTKLKPILRNAKGGHHQRTKTHLHWTKNPFNDLSNSQSFDQSESRITKRDCKFNVTQHPKAFTERHSKEVTADQLTDESSFSLVKQPKYLQAREPSPFLEPPRNAQESTPSLFKGDIEAKMGFFTQRQLQFARV